MNNKIFLKLLLLLTIIILIIIFLINRYDSNQARIQYIENYLENRYEGDFVFIKEVPSAEKGKHVYEFATNDNNDIHFNVKYWIGALDTPMGDFGLIRTKRILENFPNAIKDHVVNNSKFRDYEYDITNVSLDDCINELMDLDKKIDIIVNDYGIRWANPTITINLIVNGKEYEFSYGMSKKENVRSRLRETLRGLNKY